MTPETIVGLNELAVALLAAFIVAGVVRVIVDMVER